MDRETVDEIKRHFGVVAQGVREDVRAVAEGLETPRDEMHREFAAVRSETTREFEETSAGLETEVADLRVRLERVEKPLTS